MGRLDREASRAPREGYWAVGVMAWAAAAATAAAVAAAEKVGCWAASRGLAVFAALS